MAEVVVVEAVRTPFGKRNGGLSTTHSVELLAHTQRALIDRAGIDPREVGQVVGGCVGQVGMQTSNIARTAWLTAGLPIEVAATTVDSQCGSSQQATNLAFALLSSGVVDCAVACGVEVMSRVPMGTSTLGRGCAGWWGRGPGEACARCWRRSSRRRERPVRRSTSPWTTSPARRSSRPSC